MCIGAPCGGVPWRPGRGGCSGPLWLRTGESAKPEDPFGSAEVRAENDICGGSPPSLMNTVACTRSAHGMSHRCLTAVVTRAGKRPASGS